MKKVTLLAVAAIAAMGLLAACASNTGTTTAPAMHQDMKGEQAQDVKGENTSNS